MFCPNLHPSLNREAVHCRFSILSFSYCSRAVSCFIFLCVFFCFLHYADDLSEENLIYTFLFIKRHKSCSKKAPGQTGIAGLTWGFYQGSTWYIFGINASQVRCRRFEKCRNSKGFWVQVSILP